MENEGAFLNLHNQVDKMQKHINQLSIKTQYRYHDSAVRFCRFLADKYGVQKFENIKAKHVASYASHLLDQSLSAAYIKNELTAIRYYYDQSGGRNRLPDNRQLEEIIERPLPRRQFGKVPRAWSDEEYQKALYIAQLHGDDDVALALRFARTMGPRLHETVKATDAHCRRALSSGYITIVGKGGKIRDVPVTGAAIAVLRDALDAPRTSKKIFVPEPNKADKVMKRIENWIYRHRDEFTMSDTVLTYHGLRHAFAQERYRFHLYRLTGDDRTARLAVSAELGHERDDVTRIYMAGLNIHE